MKKTVLTVSALALALSGCADAQKTELTQNYGPIMAPAYVKAYEVDNHNKIAINPFLQVGNAEHQIVLDEGEGYVWLIDEAGNFIIAPEATTPWGRKYPQGMMRIEDGKVKKWGYKEKYGHTALVGGAKARIGGELEMENGQWIINNKSGRYNKLRDGRTEEALHKAGEYLMQIAPQVTSLEYEFKKDYGPAKPITLASMEDAEWHYMLKSAYFWDAETKKLGTKFVEDTPFITWREKVKFKEGYYMDTQDRYLKSRNEIFRVRLDVSKPKKAKFTHKVRANELDGLHPMHKGEGEIDVSASGDSYSIATDTKFNMFKFDFYNANPAEVFDYLMYKDRKAYKQITTLARFGDDVLKTDTMRQSKYKGWLNTGPYKGHEIEIQIWKQVKNPGEYGKNGVYGEPLLLEIGFEGKTKNREDLDGLNKWLFNELNKRDMLAEDQTQSKTETAFAVSGRFNTSANPARPAGNVEVDNDKLDGTKTRNLDGTVNVATTAKSVTIAGFDGVTGTVFQTEEDGQPLEVVVIGGDKNAAVAKVEVVGAQGETLVAVADESKFDTIEKRKAIAAQLDGGNKLAGYELLGDAAVDYLKPIAKEVVNPKQRSNNLYYWAGTGQ